MTDYTEKIVDFAYDHVLDYLVILTEEKVVKVFHANLDDVHWEFPTDYKYCSVLLIKKLDILIFGTSEGSIRIYIWPISNFTPKEIIDPPSFYEKFIHSDKVTLLSVSSDLQYLYTASIDGSIYISSLNGVSYDNQVNPQSFHYFDQRNILPKKVFMNYEDLIYLTDPLYKSKIENIEKRQTDKQTINSEFITGMEKQMSENNKDIQSRRQT
jgi:WD40 repeat protein